MTSNQAVSAEQFIKRLVNLCLRSGLGGMPKDEADQHILLKSAVLLIQAEGPLTEKQINETLETWLTRVCVIKNFDRVTLRRWLVDTGYLSRNSDGTGYQVARPGPKPGLFEESVDQIDVLETIRAAKEEQERRKQAFLDKTRNG